MPNEFLMDMFILLIYLFLGTKVYDLII